MVALSLWEKVMGEVFTPPIFIAIYPPDCSGIVGLLRLVGMSYGFMTTSKVQVFKINGVSVPGPNSSIPSLIVCDHVT